MRVKLTDALCGQKAPREGRIELWDVVVPGLCLRIYPSGARTFSMMPRERYRTRGRNARQRRVSLWPRYPMLSLAEARRQARDLLMTWAAGADLPELKKPGEATAAIVELWLALDQARNRSREQAGRIARRALAPWLDKPIRLIARKDIQRIVDEVRDNSGPIMARRVASVLHTLFDWAHRRQYVDLNPAAGVEKPPLSPPRERILSDDELRAVWLACRDLPHPYGDIIRLLILTGARISEVCGLTWREVDLERAEWTLPAVRAKNGREHLVPLSPQAIALIGELPRTDDPGAALFPGPLTGRPINTANASTRQRQRLTERSGVDGWVIHDLRRTVATGLQRLGVKSEITEAVLNHRSGRPAIVKVYQRYEYANEKRAALEAWGRHVDHIVTGEPAKIVNLPTRGT